MNRKWTLEIVRIEFEKRNCRLLSITYESSKKKLSYIAKCGHEHEISMDNFSKGKGDACRKCRYYYSIGDSRRLVYDDVKLLFETNGCLLLSETYNNSRTKLTYIAQCGHENQISFSKFSSGAGQVCNKCSLSIRYEFDYVKEYFENNDCYLVETEYINVKTPMRYIATCGHEYIISFDTFKNAPGASKRCDKCQKIKKHTLVDIALLMKNNGCTLVSNEYVNKRPIRYIAQCGHERKIIWSKFLIGLGRQCKKCAPPQGERHHNYNESLTDEERMKNRDLWEVIKWRNAVYERDRYTCQKCKVAKGGNLNAHHINGYNLDKENRFNIDNGITLCKDCHNDFHKTYGYGNNTQNQFDEWFHVAVSSL